jgi:hypothetical protein
MSLTIAPTIRTLHPTRAPVVVGRAFLRDGLPLVAVPRDWSDEFAARVAQALNSATARHLHDACFDGPAFDLELYAAALSLANLAMPEDPPRARPVKHALDS